MSHIKSLYDYYSIVDLKKQYMRKKESPSQL